ncbi:MAG: hypothetical protein KF724_02330 [Phycisphaeraceae bacterium]|nr:hypothetical protein [Phycisphaeraceae bacterium]
MKRAPEAALTPYQQICSRLGVQPRQFAVLLAVAGGSIALLAGKSLLSGPRSTAASSTASPVGAIAEAAAASATAAVTPPVPVESLHPITTGSDSAAASTVVLRLDTSPRRDPFQHFIERPKETRSAADAPDERSVSPPDLSLYELRATMDGEWAIINGQTLRVGDVVGLGSDGTPIRLREIGHRTAVIEWRGRTFELFFAR